MIVDQSKTLLQNKTFRITLAAGILASLANTIVYIVFTNQYNGQNCMQNVNCLGGEFCQDNYNTYCCNSPFSSQRQTCGDYYQSCYVYEYNTDYIDCNGFFTARYVLWAVQVACFVSLMVISYKHRKRQLRDAAISQFANNIIYSDRNQAYPNQQPYNPPQIINQPQPIVILNPNNQPVYHQNNNVLINPSIASENV